MKSLALRLVQYGVTREQLLELVTDTMMMQAARKPAHKLMEGLVSSVTPPEVGQEWVVMVRRDLTHETRQVPSNLLQLPSIAFPKRLPEVVSYKEFCRRPLEAIETEIFKVRGYWWNIPVLLEM